MSTYLAKNHTRVYDWLTTFFSSASARHTQTELNLTYLTLFLLNLTAIFKSCYYKLFY